MNLPASASSNASNTPRMQEDLECNHTTKSSFVRVWKVPVPLRIGHATSDMFKNVAVIASLLCIVELFYIAQLRGGLVRVPNDPFDNSFGTVGNTINHDSPEIWSLGRQAFIRDAYPVPVHSHNDYWRRIPLFEALGSGCISVEADVHLKNNDLYVGHTALSMHVSSAMTLREMYLEPLERIFRGRNGNRAIDGEWQGMYSRAPKQTFVLLVDHKTIGRGTFDELDRQLQPLRNLGYLTFWNGTARVVRPLTIVATGAAPFEAVLAMNTTDRDIFFDAPLDQLLSVYDDYTADPPIYRYNASNSYYASTRWHLARLWSGRNESLPFPQQDIEASHLEQTKPRGLLTRYWDTPKGPANLLDIVWRVLIERKVGVINMDDLGAVRARARGWGRIEL